MEHALDTIRPALAAIREPLTIRLRSALSQLICDFEVRMSDGGLLTCYVTSLGIRALTLHGTIQVDIDRDAWAAPFKPSKSHHEGDQVAHAGAYVLDGLDFKSSVSVPAMNTGSLEVLSHVATIGQFTQIIIAGEAYLQDMVARRKHEIGTAYLKAIGVEP